MENKESCYDQPCFIMTDKDSPIGLCEKTKAYILTDQAKQNKYCKTEKECTKRLEEQKTYILTFKAKPKTFDKIKTFLLCETDARLVEVREVKA